MARALRFALTQKVKVSSMVAGDRLFVDLLPESWTGEPPGLPREVVEELAKRANEADRVARQKLAAEEQKKIPPVRVRVAAQPTFTRYIFELPELTGVTAERGKDKLTLTFAKPLRFDLSDAKLAAAKAVTAVDAGGRRRQSRGAIQVLAAGRYPHVPRGFELRRRRQPDRRQGTSRCCCGQSARRRYSAGNDSGQRAQAVRIQVVRT